MQSTIIDVLEHHHRENNFSGVCLVTQGDTIVVQQGFGLAHRGYNVPNGPDIRYDIASITKLFTAVAIMQIVDEGKLALDTPVMPFLGIDDTKISDEVTLYHCLTHTSGIADDADEEAGEDYELLFVDTPNYSIRETRDFLPQFAWKDPVFAPGEGVRYNNCAYVLLGLVIEQVSGLTYRDYVRKNIFAPAGMTAADFLAMDGVAPNMAEHYKHLDGEVRKNIYSYPPIGSPDGGATVTAMDLDRFIRALHSHALMSETATNEFLSPHVHHEDIEPGSLWNGFGMEFRLDHAGTVVEYGKDGINAGVASTMCYIPRSDTTVVLLANQDCDVWTLQDAITGVIPG